ncbi:hypothetical protein F4692_001724 [Nocardioides cavernae]|uniref:Uncharacterized protein n=1 Tax=Nocardioides cavernae TaxID=1921566 RepID=A0A7Y9H263_9ACTN|nr:hypothetical protein [Nocardioides cavernae]NYE36591.1 hypothetical protein [Nocardioides cavernae]
MPLPTPGLFAECDTVTYEVAGTAADWLMLLVPRGTSVEPPHLGEGEDRQGRRWVKVAKARVARYFRVEVTVAWQGERLELGRLAGDTAEVHASSPPVAARLGLEGDQYNGFRAMVPVDELTVVDVREKEIDV